MNVGNVSIERKKHPFLDSGFLSRITYFYIKDFLKKYFAKEINENDLYDTLPSLKSQKLGDELENMWQKSKRPNIAKILLRKFGNQYIVYTLVYLVFHLIRTYLEPFLITNIISTFIPNQKTAKEAKFNKAIASALGLIVFYVINNTTINYYFFVIQNIGLKVAVGLSSLLYRKMLRLKAKTVTEEASNIVTLITKDVLMFDTVIILLSTIFYFCISFILTAVLIHRRVGIVGLSISLMIILTISCQLLLSKKMYNQRLRVALDTAKRVEIIREVISSIRVIKMYTWESHFIEKIKNARRKELKGIFLLSLIRFLILIVGMICSSTNFFIFCIIYMNVYQSISTEDLFYVMVLVNSLRYFFTLALPLGVSELGELYSAYKRIQDFLSLEERPVKNKFVDSTKRIIRFQNVSLEKGYLSKIFFSLEDNGLFLVTGPVSCGKSLLIKSILGEFLLNGFHLIHGKLSYASQEPWIFPSTIRQNIIFGEAINNERYEQVLEICALNFDLQQFEKRDQTILIDKGANLSKGQQARVNLARAIYRKADIYLLDDSLNALDHSVGMSVFQKCAEFLKDKIVILVTQNPSYLKCKIDKKILLVQNGTINFVTDYENDFHEYENQIQVAANDTNKFVDFNDCDNASNEIQKEEDKLLKVFENNNIYHEDINIGMVTWKTIKLYCKYGGGYFLVLLSSFAFILFGVSNELNYKFVSKWVEAEEKLFTFNSSNPHLEVILHESRNYSFNFYIIVFVSSILFGIFRVVLHFFIAAKASIGIHDAMSNAAINAKLAFFDTHLVGNIINRFSKDIYNLDENIPYFSFQVFMMGTDIIGHLVLVAITNWFLCLLVILTAIIYLIFVRYIFVPMICTLKRLESAVHSPMVGYLNATIEGMQTIHVTGNKKLLVEEFDKHQDKYSSAYFTIFAAAKAFALNMEYFGILLLITVFSYIFAIQNITATDVGLCIVVFGNLFGYISVFSRRLIELLGYLTSAERALSYIDIKSETSCGFEVGDWPDKGQINFKNVSLIYPTNNLRALKNITFDVSEKEKIGIIGRTGSGKSSLISTLYRFYDFHGQICIDNVNIQNLSLSYRSKIDVIPQDPIVFSGTIRDNLDPYRKFSDDELWQSLKKVNLNVNLDEEVNSLDLSTGQKQLIYLARILLTNKKIVIMDEATSNLDPKTDNYIYDILKTNLKECTVLVIAHKLDILKDVEKILILDNGRVKDIIKRNNFKI